VNTGWRNDIGVTSGPKSIASVLSASQVSDGQRSSAS